MPWFKVDDNLAFHPKVLLSGNEAMGVWIRAGSWSAQMLTDGFVPADVVETLSRRGDGPCDACGAPPEKGASLTPAPADRLIHAGLWVPERHGFRFHQWEERQPTKRSVDERRAADRRRKARQRKGDDR